MFARILDRCIKKKRKVACICFFFCLFLFFLFSYQKPFVNVQYATVVLDKNNDLLGARLAPDQQWRFAPSTHISSKYFQCVQQFEDQYFRYHFGINPISIARSLYHNFKYGKIVSGGSTITMQVARLDSKGKRNYWQKILEMCYAIQLEFWNSKETIFRMYATHVPFGGNIVGVESAAYRYFGHTADELSWAEAATLAVLPNAPSTVNMTKQRDILLKKRDLLLLKLLKNKVIDDTTYQLALMEELPQTQTFFPTIAPHLIEKLHLEYTGHTLHTTIDPKIQFNVENILLTHHNELIGNHIHHLAAMVVDVKSNSVVAYCGNVKEDRHEGYQVNMIDARRSPGSLLKPFLYYKALEQGNILSHTLLPDLPINLQGFTPKNYLNTYDGAVYASQALVRSLNIPFIDLLRKYGVENFYQFLIEIGCTTLSKPSSHYGLSLILGGLEVTMWNLATIYTQAARILNRFDTQFKYSSDDLKPLSLLRPLPLQLAPQQNRAITFEASSLYLTFKTLLEVNSEENSLKKFSTNRKIAFKTGTSFGFRDAWSLGITPEFLVLVWVGNASGEGRPGLVGGMCAAPVLFDIFGCLPPSTWFASPDSELEKVRICTKSGMLAGTNCGTLDTIWESKSAHSSSPCKYCQRVMVTTDQRERVYKQCADPKENYVYKSWFVLPPAWEYYYQHRHPNYRRLPPLSKACMESTTQTPMQFIYPLSKGLFRIPRQLDGTQSKVIFKLAHRNAGIRIFWYLDDQYITTTQDFHEIELQPPIGKHRVTVIDSDGYELYQTIEVEK